MNILEAFEKSDKVDNRSRDITLEIDKDGFLFAHRGGGCAMQDGRLDN